MSKASEDKTNIATESGPSKSTPPVKSNRSYGTVASHRWCTLAQLLLKALEETDFYGSTDPKATKWVLVEANVNKALAMPAIQTLLGKPDFPDMTNRAATFYKAVRTWYLSTKKLCETASGAGELKHLPEGATDLGPEEVALLPKMSDEARELYQQLDAHFTNLPAKTNKQKAKQEAATSRALNMRDALTADLSGAKRRRDQLTHITTEAPPPKRASASLSDDDESDDISNGKGGDNEDAVVDIQRVKPEADTTAADLRSAKKERGKQDRKQKWKGEPYHSKAPVGDKLISVLGDLITTSKEEHSHAMELDQARHDHRMQELAAEESILRLKLQLAQIK
jgi:hypothetical protein